MAIIRSIVVGRGSKGSIGDVTVRTIAGRVIASQKVPKKAGLSTLAQVMHQVKLSNIVRAFSELNLTAPNGKGMYQSFPDRPATLSNYNMFVKYNFAVPEVAAVSQSKEEAAADLLVPAPFIVTRGNLASIESQFTIVQETSTDPSYLVTPVTSVQPGPQTTLGDFYTALADFIELRQGDTLTFFVMSFKPTGEPATKMFALQFIVDFNSTDAMPSYFQAVSGHVCIEVSTALGISGFDIDVAPVLGRNTANGYAVSNSQFTNNCLTSASYIAHSSDAKGMEAAASYGYKEDPFLQQ